MSGELIRPSDGQAGIAVVLYRARSQDAQHADGFFAACAWFFARLDAVGQSAPIRASGACLAEWPHKMARWW